ncbi:HpcH/HpaI aldolase family protein [Cupriavidus basilensis]|uniref:HpcH/HpaI aldolase family protein n=1 Tax=Cupriavidus basilensis TaxID=68895 RepID=UPI0023E7A0A3|nr:aldolase/citrate lyase family protein [Cupriavidus basilensis]MDF3883017.1 aldolase/citrate lyase family protein [Cupriavidus basilensis]
MNANSSFKRRVRERQTLLGTFIKTPAFQTLEVLGESGLDFTVIDAEHAPLDRGHLDVMAMAAVSAQIPTLVRIADATERSILQVLDVGYTGVLVPHAISAADVVHVVRASRYKDGTRGFSNSPRAGRYGRVGMAAHIAAADEASVVLCQIEDSLAIDNIDEIAAIEDIDCLFVGRGDLAVSFGKTSVTEDQVVAAVRKVADACERHGKASGIFISSLSELREFREMGFTLFILGSDQGLLRGAASSMAAQFRAEAGR